MKLIPVDAIPKVSGYHKLQDLIEEFVNGDAKELIVALLISLLLVTLIPGISTILPAIMK